MRLNKDGHTLVILSRDLIVSGGGSQYILQNYIINRWSLYISSFKSDIKIKIKINACMYI